MMNILVFGAGAIGTYVGGSLALAGQRVVFLEQMQIVPGLQESGLRLEIEGKVHTIRQPMLAGAIQDALAWGPFDAAVFALKSNDTQAVLESLAPYTAGNTLPPFLCLQNGVDNEPALAAALGPHRVIAGTVTSAVGRNGTGDIHLERKRGMGLAAGHPLSTRLAEALNGAGLRCHLYAHAAAMKRSKLLTNLLANASSAILDMTPAEIFANPGLYRLEIRQLREALRVMDARTIPVVNLPGTPVRLLAFAVRSLPSALCRPFLARAVGGGRGGKMPSFHIDLHAGRGTSEVDYLNGAVVRHGERLRVPAPANRFLTETLLALTARRLPMETYTRQPEKLLQAIGE